jgi:hypothetical protein
MDHPAHYQVLEVPCSFHFEALQTGEHPVQWPSSGERRLVQPGSVSTMNLKPKKEITPEVSAGDSLLRMAERRTPSTIASALA